MLLAAVLILTSVVLTNASTAVDFPVTLLNPCQSSSDMNCISGLTVTFPDGHSADAVLTGTNTTATCGGVTNLTNPCSYYEWSVPGLVNGDSKNFIQTSGWIQPPTQTLNNANQPPGGLLMFIDSSGWKSVYQPNSPKCADPQVNCRESYPLQKDALFTIKVRENIMQPAYTSGTLLDSKVQTELTGNTYNISYSGEAGPSAGIITTPSSPNLEAPNQADFDTNMWSIRTIDANESEIPGAGCNGANPSLMTDALWVNLPNFDKQTRSVSLNVNNPHLDAEGNVVSGHFQGYFPASFTKCYWGLDPEAAAGQAKISITENDGNADVAILSTKADANGLTVTASGFHYSSPVIHIQLPSQSDPSPTPTPVTTVASSTPTPSSTAKPVSKTIKCTKGNVKKTVSGTTCPKGYKVSK